MQCPKCGTPINRNCLGEDGFLVCPGCNTVYKRKQQSIQAKNRKPIRKGKGRIALTFLILVMVISGVTGAVLLTQNKKQSDQAENEARSQMVVPGTTESQNTMQTTLSSAPGIPRTTEPYGILIVSKKIGDSYYYDNSGNYLCTVFTVTLDCIDPETGRVTRYKSFSSEGTHSCSAVLGGIGANTTETKRNFSEDFSKMTASVMMEDGSEHIGWCDENGAFTDVSAQITQQNDFSGLVKHTHPCFFGGYIYFRDLSNRNAQIKRVLINNLTPSAVEVMVDNTSFNGLLVYPFPDGRAVDDNTSIQEYYDISMQYAANTNFFSDWIDVSHCLGSDDGMVYLYDLEKTTSSYEWYNTRTPLVPNITGRINWSAVASPDGNRVAFLSKLTNGNDTSTSLFVVPINGGDPVKINTDYGLSGDNAIYGARTEFGLLDWFK